MEGSIDDSTSPSVESVAGSRPLSSSPKHNISDSLALKMSKTRPEKILVITVVRISSDDKVQDEVNRLRVYSDALCRFHATCDWIVHFVFNQKRLESDSKRALESLPMNIQINLHMQSHSITKFAAINETVLEYMGGYDYILFKDSDQRLAGLPWNTFMNRKGDAMVSGVLRQTQSESMHKATYLANLQRNKFHEGQFWKQPWMSSGRWATTIFEESRSFEVPFIENYFVLNRYETVNRVV